MKHFEENHENKSVIERITEEALSRGYDSLEHYDKTLALIDVYDEGYEDQLEAYALGEVVNPGPRKLWGFPWAEEFRGDKKAERIRTDEERLAVCTIHLRDFCDSLNLDPEIMRLWEEGEPAISYIDEDLNSHILKMSDDPWTMEFKKKLEDEWDVTVYHAMKWDVGESPAFLCLSDDYSDYYFQAGLGLGTWKRDIHAPLYFWADGESYIESYQVDEHNGALYPILAFPGLRETDHDPEKSVYRGERDYIKKGTYEDVKGKYNG